MNLEYAQVSINYRFLIFINLSITISFYCGRILMNDSSNAAASIPNITVRDTAIGISKNSDTIILHPIKNNIMANPGLR